MERSQVSPLTASGGDYPDDTQAALRPAAGRTTLNRMFARGFLHWLRTAHTRPRVDSAISVINAPLKVVPNPYTGRVRPIVYWIDENGEMLVSAPAENPFSQQTVFQNQDSLLAYDSVNLDSKFWTVSLRDLVSRLGNQEGGKHAGQPLAPSKNWRSISGGLPITERSPAAPSANAAAANATTLPRVRNFYQEGRLAFEFQLMAPRAISAQLNSTH